MMALLYGMICSWVVVLRKFAAWKHDRLKKNYAAAADSFKVTETDCKNDEVAMGRPADYGVQLRLMKQFDDKIKKVLLVGTDYVVEKHIKTKWIAENQRLNCV